MNLLITFDLGTISTAFSIIDVTFVRFLLCFKYIHDMLYTFLFCPSLHTVKRFFVSRLFAYCFYVTTIEIAVICQIKCSFARVTNVKWLSVCL